MLHVPSQTSSQTSCHSYQCLPGARQWMVVVQRIVHVCVPWPGALAAWPGVTHSEQKDDGIWAEQEMFDMARQDHREFHDLCKSLLCFEPSSRLTAAKAVEHQFFNLDITPEYSEESLLLYPDAPIPPPTMPPPVNAAASKVADAGSGMPSLSGVSSGLAGVVGLDEFPRGTASDAVGPAGPSTFYQGLAPNTAVAQQVSYSLHVPCVLSPIRKCLCVGPCLRPFFARLCVGSFASVRSSASVRVLASLPQCVATTLRC